MYTQENKSLKITTPLGENKVLLTRFSGTESLSAPFSFDLSLVSEDRNLKFQEIIGKNITVSIDHGNKGTRFFNGLISHFAIGSSSGNKENTESAHGLWRYSAKMVPWFWLFTRSKNSRIFQNISVPDIVEKIFIEKGYKDYSMNIGKYDPKEYCVQYNETDFNFVSRLLEQEGIYYFFKHEDRKHTMVLADKPEGHSQYPYPNKEDQSVQYHPATGGERPMNDVIVDLDKMQEIRFGKYTVNDFDFEKPKADLKVEAPSKSSLGPGEREYYDYPGEYRKRPEGERLANIRLEAEEARVTTITGKSSCKGFSSGYKFELSDHYRSELNSKSYVLVSVSHDVSEAAGPSGEHVGADYTNRFTCIPFDVPYRPPLVTPKPKIGGVQTAMVVGPSDQEIHTDEHGRVKVQFPWDREGKSNEDSSCWIRVSQPWTGTGWGAVYLPRIGQEVIVEFLESDPDRPIITGRVFNAINTPPYPLPGEKTKSTFKSMSSPDGGGFNEFRFEDKKGEEQLFIHAEKNQDIRTKNDRLEWVGKDSHLIVTKDQLEKVEGDKHLTVKGDHNEKVDGTVSLKVGMDMQEKVGMKHALDAGMEIHLKAGMKVILEAGTQVSLKAGGSFVDIGPAGVTIQGAMININSGGLAGAGSGASPEMPKLPLEADKATPGEKAKVEDATTPSISGSPPPLTPQAQAFKAAADSGTPFCET